MQCALVLYFVVTVFVIVRCSLDLCVFEADAKSVAHCSRHDTEYTYDFIPPISQFILYIDLSGQPLRQLPYNAFQNLSSQSNISTIRLRHCNISHIDTDAMMNLHNLTIIDMSNNDLKQIDSKLFEYTKRIKIIYMEHNKIEALPKGLFQNLILLEEVHLQHNQIRQVERNSFRNTPLLRLIDLNSNQIQFMNMSFKDKFVNLRNLSLYGNPWECDCNLLQIYDLLIKLNEQYLEILMCENPLALRGRKWNNISREEFVCSSGVSSSTLASIITTMRPAITTEILATNSTVIKSDTSEGMNRNKVPTYIEEETINNEKPETLTNESSKPVSARRKPKTKMEKTDATVKPDDEKQVLKVKEDTDSSETRNGEAPTGEPDIHTEESNTETEEPTSKQSAFERAVPKIITEEPTINVSTTIKTSSQKPVDEQNTTNEYTDTTSENSFTNSEEPEGSFEQFLKDLQWMQWILFSVALICLLIVIITLLCAARFTYTSLKRRILAVSV